MKTHTLLILLLTFSSISGYAQLVEITPMYGYTVNGSIRTYYGEYKIEDVDVGGWLLDIEVRPLTYLELSYRRSTTTVINKSSSVFDHRIDVGYEHYHIGVLREFKEGKVVPYSLFTLGSTRYFENEEFNAESWEFSINFGIGGKIFFKDALGIRLQTNLFMPMQFNGVGIGCGVGTGGASCGGGATFNVPTVHWNFEGGLIIRIGSK